MPPKKRSAAASTDPVSESIAATRPRRTRAQAAAILDEDSEPNDVEPTVAPAKKQKTLAKKAGRKKNAKVEEAEAEADEVEAGKAELEDMQAGEEAAKPADEGKQEPDSVQEPPKVVTGLKKGSAVVDTGAPANLQQAFHVLEKDGIIYDALLNQTDITNNNNKFYIIQVLKQDNAEKYVAWNRWGRVGNNGTSAQPEYSTPDAAIREFEKKFKDKTANNWSERENFDKKPKKYYLLERDWGEDENEDADANTDAKQATNVGEAKPIPESKLDPSVQELVKLIFNLEMMEKEMTEIGYDAKKMPLGKLTKRTIEKGYLELKAISDELDKSIPDRRTLSQLSSNFYTIIPHAFGMRTPPIITTKHMLADKLRMVEALGDIQITQTLLKTVGNMSMNPVDSKFESLKVGMVPVSKVSESFKLVETYTKNTHGHTHRQYKLKVEEVFELAKEDKFEDLGSKLHNRKLLWHGSRLTNYAGILSQGLRIAPPEAPVTGYMFGKGVYFADMVSKSANYCFTNPNNNTGLLLLCEVALGDESKLIQSDYHADETMKSRSKHSTWGMGRTVPESSGYVTLPDGVVVPCGPGTHADETDEHGKRYLEYNEFICYDLRQVRLRYLVKMKFEYGR
ncbi:poly polymerase catalytic domain-containing protein [Chytriomyces sp. MP71]|nr:poly polymerase catalytic domain-containing protein [Chytriomyces sp. MP71]